MPKIKSKKLEDLKVKLEKQENKNRYWEVEEPEIIKEKNFEIQYYKQAGALQLRLYKENKLFRSVSLRKFKLQKQPEILTGIIDVLNKWKEEI
ncbi:MAG: hypothetical protein ACOCRX_08640 [Candidatus Woesearchaeota archaeon]